VKRSPSKDRAAREEHRLQPIERGRNAGRGEKAGKKKQAEKSPILRGEKQPKAHQTTFTGRPKS